MTAVKETMGEHISHMFNHQYLKRKLAFDLTVFITVKHKRSLYEIVLNSVTITIVFLNFPLKGS